MDRLTYGILVLLFNSYGITSFMNNNANKGIFTIISAFITCGIVGIINGIKGIIMGIKILTMTDEEFNATDKAAFEDTIVLLYKEK